MLLVLTLVYVAALSLSAFMDLPKLFIRNEWSELGVNVFLWRLAISLFSWVWSVVLVCILMRMHRGRRLLGREMPWGMYITGTGLMLASFLFPFVDGYTIEMGLFIQFRDFFTIDGVPFMIGLLCLILGYILRIGLACQNEVEETI